MELNDWILALHLLAAFSLFAAEVAFATMIAGLWRSDSPSRIASTTPLARVAVPLVAVGTAGTVVFGVWLAISLDAYELWDGWVLAALVLWAVSSYLGQKVGEHYAAGGLLAEKLAAEGTTSSPELAETFGVTRALWLHVLSNVLIVLILIDMVWKPGA